MNVLLNFPKESISEKIQFGNNENNNDFIYIPIGKGGIKIKKSHRGRFTEYCGGKVTDACIQRGKNSSSAAVRKQATFAENARAWKHQEGGTLKPVDLGKYFAEYTFKAPTYYKPQEESTPSLPVNEYNIPDKQETSSETPEVAIGLATLPAYKNRQTEDVEITNMNDQVSEGKRKGIYADTEEGKKQFVKDLNAAFLNAGVVNEDLRKILVAQNALESGWGAKSVGGGDYNYGNITVGSSWKGAYRRAYDHDAKGNRIVQKFRSYNSLADYAADKLKLLGAGTRYNIDFNKDDALTYIDKVVKGGYAVDPNYRTTLTNMYNSIKNRWNA